LVPEVWRGNSWGKCDCDYVRARGLRALRPGGEAMSKTRFSYEEIAAHLRTDSDRVWWLTHLLLFGELSGESAKLARGYLIILLGAKE